MSLNYTFSKHFTLLYRNNYLVNRFSSTAAVSYESDIERDALHTFANKKQFDVSLKLLLETGNGSLLDSFGYGSKMSTNVSERVKMQVACFLHRELPVRIAHRAKELESLPIMCASPFVQEVCNWYKESFRVLRASPLPVDAQKEEAFAKVVQSVFDRHSTTLITMAKGAHDIRRMLNQDLITFAEHNEIQTNLDKFYMSRIGIRMLIGQYLALRKQMESSNDKDGNDNVEIIGLVHKRASPHMIALEAIHDATYVCTRTHGDAPEVTIHGRTDLTFPYIPSHLHYMLLELLKNSMRATVEFHGVNNKLPPIRVVIADGEDNEDVVIKVSDEGGGIPRSLINRIWSYLFTTADPKILDRLLSESDEIRDFDTASPLAGLGYGLPISRNYARYFGGDLVVMSMEGYGTDSFIYLPRLGTRSSVLK